MNIWKIKKKLVSEDKMRNVELRVSPDGELFRYYVNVWIAVDEDELLYHPEGGYWSCPKISGYYSSLSECEKAAHSTVQWLRQSK
jgi:hypothetical protein